MAKKKNAKKKSGIPFEVEEAILGMSPTDLSVEVTFERNAIDALNTQKKNDDQIGKLKEEVQALDKQLKSEADVVKAKEAYDKVLAAHMTDEHLDAKENLAALNKGWNDDIKNRKQKLKYMEDTLKRHIESGALKRKK